MTTARTNALQTVHDLLLARHLNHLHQHLHAAQLTDLHTARRVQPADVHQNAREVEHNFSNARVGEALRGERHHARRGRALLHQRVPAVVLSGVRVEALTGVLSEILTHVLSGVLTEG